MTQLSLSTPTPAPTQSQSLTQVWLLSKKLKKWQQLVMGAPPGNAGDLWRIKGKHRKRTPLLWTPALPVLLSDWACDNVHRDSVYDPGWQEPYTGFPFTVLTPYSHNYVHLYAVLT